MKKNEMAKPVRNDENQLPVSVAVTENPNISQARVGEEVRISKRSVYQFREI